MKLLMLALVLAVIGGCAPPPILPPPPPPAVENAVDRFEGEFFIAERLWPRPERVLRVGEQLLVRLRLTAKRNLEYAYWREVLGGYAAAFSDLEFYVYYIPAGGVKSWEYLLIGVSPGANRLTGVIQYASRPHGERVFLNGQIEVR